MPDAAERLRVEALALAPGAAPHDEIVRAGEVIGLAGLDGHGQETFLEILAGLRAPHAGRVLLTLPDGRVSPVSGFRQAARDGIAYLARDRRANGIFPSLSVLDNFGIVSFAAGCRGGLLHRRTRLRRYEIYRERLSIVAPTPDAAITALSGGNQQKVLLARWLARDPRVLLLNDPTRGVDQRTRETLYEVFRALARDDGMALVMVSTEIEEILRLCQRVLVFRDGQVAAELRRRGDDAASASSPPCSGGRHERPRALRAHAAAARRDSGFALLLFVLLLVINHRAQSGPVRAGRLGHDDRPGRAADRRGHRLHAGDPRRARRHRRLGRPAHGASSTRCWCRA